MSNNPLKCYVLCNVRRGSDYKVADEIRGMKGVEEALVLRDNGICDIVVKGVYEELIGVDGLVTNIRRLEDVERTVTLLSCVQ